MSIRRPGSPTCCAALPIIPPGGCTSCCPGTGTRRRSGTPSPRKIPRCRSCRLHAVSPRPRPDAYVVAAVGGVEEPARRMDRDLGCAVRSVVPGRFGREGLQFLADLPRGGVVGKSRNRRIQLIHDVEALAAQVECDMTRSGAGRHRRLADPRETAVGEAEDLNFVDAEISRSDEVAGRVEDDAVRMRRFLALLVRAATSILDLPAHGAEPTIDLDRQDDEA